MQQSSSFCSLALWFLLLTAPALGASPFENGTHHVSDFNKGNIIFHKNGASMGLHIWSPTESGEYPVFIFATGFGADAPSIAYGIILEHIASHGYIVVSLDQLKYPQPSKYVDVVTQAVDWLDENLGPLVAKHIKKTVTCSFDKAMALGAHSSGNHMTVSYLNSTCGKAKALVMIDPVDGADPFGIVKNFIIQPGTPVNFKIPALMLDNGLDPTRKGVDPACAPAKLSCDRFYNAWDAPIWNVNATQFGHVDCLDANIAKVGKLLCPGFDGDISPFQTQVGGLAVAFLDAVFHGATANLDLIEDSASMLVDSTVKHDLHGMDRAVTPFCQHK